MLNQYKQSIYIFIKSTIPNKLFAPTSQPLTQKLGERLVISHQTRKALALLFGFKPQ